MPTSRALALSCHPGPTVVVTTVSVALAVAVDQTPLGLLLVGVTVLIGQLSIGWSNDWLDASRDLVSDRTDKPVAVGQVSASLVRSAAFTALALSLPLSFLNGVSSGWAHCGLVGSGWAYNLGLKRTLWSWTPYALGFGLLPAFVTLSLPAAPWPPWWAMAAGALLGVGAHFANVLPDIDEDLAHGVRGLPQRLGSQRCGSVAIALLLAASGLLVVAPVGSPTAVMWCGSVVVLILVGWASSALVGRGSASRVFQAAMLISLVDALLLVNAAAVVAG